MLHHLLILCCSPRVQAAVYVIEPTGDDPSVAEGLGLNELQDVINSAVAMWNMIPPEIQQMILHVLAYAGKLAACAAIQVRGPGHQHCRPAGVSMYAAMVAAICPAAGAPGALSPGSPPGTLRPRWRVSQVLIPGYTGWPCVF